MEKLKIRKTPEVCNMQYTLQRERLPLKSVTTYAQCRLALGVARVKGARSRLNGLKNLA